VSVGLTNVFPGTPPNGLANALFLNANNISSTASATVTLSLAALGLSGITRAVIWYSNPGGNNSVFKSYQVLKNGSFLVNRGEGSWPWAAETFNCTSTDTLVLRQVGNQGFASSQTSPAGIALIELYAAADPYMKFDVVVYNGLFYQSNVDNNAATPGGAGWTLLGGVPTGGTAGQVLKKNSTADFDVSWTSLASLLAVGTVDEPPAVANAKSDEFESTTMNAMWSYRGITATSANLTRFPGALLLAQLARVCIKPFPLGTFESTPICPASLLQIVKCGARSSSIQLEPAFNWRLTNRPEILLHTFGR
jgi:hypothetical protein